jgi:hypothetical protein
MSKDSFKIAFGSLFVICIIAIAFMSNTIGKQKKVIEAYQQSLESCENQDVVDKIFDKIRERHND